LKILILLNYFGVSFFFISLYAQNENLSIVSVLTAGNCNNALQYDYYIDSICKKHNYTHQYYLKGIKKHELSEYSLKIFEKQIDSSIVIDDTKALRWDLINTDPKNQLFFIRNDKIIKKGIKFL
jgi:hypothetical protein